jgi:hypothetical protein
VPAPGGDLRHQLGPIHLHAAGAEHQRLDDEGGKGIGLLAQQGNEGIDRAFLRSARRKRNTGYVEQHRIIGCIEDAPVANRHRAKHIAVIGVFHCDDAMALVSAIVPAADRHLDRDLDRGRSAVRKEHMSKAPGRDR